VAIGRGVFHILQVALRNRNVEPRLHHAVISPAGRFGHCLGQRRQLCRCLHAQGGAGILAGDAQRLLPGQDESRKQDEQYRTHDPALRAEAGRA